MMTKKQENVKAGRNESGSDQESVDYHEIWDSMQESCEEMMKNGEETNDYGDTMQIHDELHEKLLQIKAKQWDSWFWWFFFVHLTIAMWESNLCKKIYWRNEFRDHKWCWKQKLCGESHLYFHLTRGDIEPKEHDKVIPDTNLED